MTTETRTCRDCDTRFEAEWSTVAVRCPDCRRARRAAKYTPVALPTRQEQARLHGRAVQRDARANGATAAEAHAAGVAAFYRAMGTEQPS